MAGRLVKMRPPGVNKLGHSAAAGQIATGEPLPEQAVAVQLDKPAVRVSFAMALLAALGPALLKVMV